MFVRTEAACDPKEMPSHSSTLSMQRIASWLEPQKIILDAELRNRRHALESAAAEMGSMHGLDPEPILQALWRREQVGSTALGCGIAIPHARIDGIKRPMTLFMRAKWAIEFDAPDGKPVGNILVIMVPTNGGHRRAPPTARHDRADVSGP